MTIPSSDDAEPTRVRVHTSLTERPLFGGTDMEVWVLAGFLIWSSFLMFRLTVPFFLVTASCGVLIAAIRMANARDPFFLPILFRSMVYRRLYAPRASATESHPGRPSLPRRALPS